MRDFGNWLLRWAVLAVMLVFLAAMAVWLLLVWVWGCFCEFVARQAAREEF